MEPVHVAPTEELTPISLDLFGESDATKKSDWACPGRHLKKTSIMIMRIT